MQQLEPRHRGGMPLGEGPVNSQHRRPAAAGPLPARNSFLHASLNPMSISFPKKKKLLRVKNVFNLFTLLSTKPPTNQTVRYRAQEEMGQDDPETRSTALRFQQPGLVACPTKLPPKGSRSNPYPPVEGSKLKPRNPKTEWKVLLQWLKAQ